MFETPPRKKSLPFADVASTTSWFWISTGAKLAPPSVDSYRPTRAAPGGVKRPPFTDEEPCRATSVPMKMWLGSVGSTATAPIERPVETGHSDRLAAQGAVGATLPKTGVQVWPPSSDL